MRTLGIDEAGRGCVLGPLVVAGYLIVGDEDEVVAAGAGDSKAMSARRRAEVRARLESLGTPDARPIPATAIDQGNLNALEEEAVLSLIVTHRPDRVVLDALGHPRTLPALARRLLDALAPHGLAPELVIEPKADANHPSCGAASVFAKTTRDAALDALREPWGDFGSGYPSDPKTRAWISAWAATGKPWPAFVRTRWQTIQDLAQASLFTSSE